MNDIDKAVSRYNSLRNILLNNNFNVSEFKPINYGLQFSVERLEWLGIIRIYQNKKSEVKIDLSQLGSDENSVLLETLIGVQSSHPFREEGSVNLDDISLPVIGSDESGKGDYFGPLVSACIFVDQNVENRLQQIGVKDSKSLSDSKILELARSIRKACDHQFVVIEISAERYNQLYSKFTDEKKSLNDLLAWAHAKSLEEILLSVECSTAIIDQFADERLIHQKLQEKGKSLNIIQAHRAERHIAVAAASILARERFITKLNKLGNQYQTTLPKGASKTVVAVAKSLIEKNGTDVLKKIAKLHFKTTKEVLK